MVFALSLLDKIGPGQFEWGGPRHAMALGKVMQAASLVRKQHGLSTAMDDETVSQILSPESLENWHKTLQTGALATRGTTQISVADAEGNLASMTLSNGEGSSYVLPGSGIMLNNMLGEEDLNPEGFNRWPRDVRVSSMMAPTLADDYLGELAP